MIEDAGLYVADADMYCMVCGDELDTYVHLPTEYEAIALCACITCALLGQ